MILFVRYFSVCFHQLIGSNLHFLMFFHFGELAWLASIKCRFVRPCERSIRLFLSRLPARGATFPTRRGCAILLNQLSGEQFGLQTKRSVEADRLSDHQRKKGGVSIFSPSPWLLSPPVRWVLGNFADFEVALPAGFGGGVIWKCHGRPAREWSRPRWPCHTK